MFLFSPLAKRNKRVVEKSREFKNGKTREYIFDNLNKARKLSNDDFQIYLLFCVLTISRCGIE